MARLDSIINPFRSMAGPLLVAAMLTYFGYHAIQGERGVLTWLQLNHQIERTHIALDESRAEESRMALRVALLRSENLDPDMLDERARTLLNFAAPGELVLFVDPLGTAR